MHLPVPPVVDFGTAVVENWGAGYRNRELRHIGWYPLLFIHELRMISIPGVIVAKTGHDRGQKEMYLYSPTVKRHGVFVSRASETKRLHALVSNGCNDPRTYPFISELCTEAAA